MEQKEYEVEIYVIHKVKLWADDEEDAKEKAQSKVFKEKVNYEAGDLITGYKVLPL